MFASVHPSKVAGHFSDRKEAHLSDCAGIDDGPKHVLFNLSAAK